MRKNKTKITNETLWHSIDIEKVFNLLKSDKDGLTKEEVLKRKKTYGRNVLPTKKTPSFLFIFFKQFINPIIFILIGAAIASILIKERVDAFFIMLVVLINSTLGSIQERNAEKTAASLNSLVRVKVRVRRDLKEEIIDSEELVPGDVVFLVSGDKVAADIRLIEVNNLTIDESFLTGESLPFLKVADKISETALISERKNMCFAGSKIISGRGVGIVVKTGLKTEVGKIAEEVIMAKETPPPLVIRMRKFTRHITIVVLIVAILFTVILSLDGYPAKEIFFFVVALSVSAIPEGLPVALTVVLSIATKKMLKNNVIIRKLTAVESLGSCTVIASDKTGTLTVNEQTVRRVLLPNGALFEVTGEGYNGIGEVKPLNDNASFDDLKELVKVSILANEAKLEKDNNNWLCYGDYMDIAILSLGYKLKIDKEALLKENNVLSTIPYESENKYSATFYKKDKHYIGIKGAVETILEFSTHMKDSEGIKKIDKDLIEKQAEDLAKKGYRVLAVATAEVNNFLDKRNYDTKDIPNLTFLGLLAFIDPLRKESISAVLKCHRAGIKVLMITGDHPLTASAIAKELGILEENESAITGKELEDLLSRSVEEFDNVVKTNTVFARISPSQKALIVKSLRKNNEFVAVTGDGVNDAPALQKANIGIAMGSGTDVAKETGSMIIIDDNFSSIVSGVEEGRFAYDNIRKVIYLLVSTGFAEIMVFFLAIFANLPLPFVAVQLLWLNLVTNGIQDVALAFEGGEEKTMERPPRNPKEKIFDFQMIKQTLISGLIMSIAVFGLWYYLINSLHFDEAIARNYVLLLMIFMQNIHVFNCRSEKKSVFKIPFKNNKLLIFGVMGALLLHIAATHIPFMQEVLMTSPIGLSDAVMIFLLAIPLLFIMEIVKFIANKKEKFIKDNCDN